MPKLSLLFVGGRLLLPYHPDMYMLAVVAAHVDHPKLRHRLERHFSELAQTGLAGTAVFHSFGDVLLAYDASSPFAEFERHGHGFTLTGGYRATLESGEAYGSFATIALDANGDAPELTTFADPLYPWPMYYGLHNGVAAVGNDVHAVAIALGRYELDERAIIELATRNWVIGRYSTVAGVSRIWPGERLDFTARSDQLPGSLQPMPWQERPGYDAAADAPGFDVDAHIEQTFESLKAAMPALGLDRPDALIQLSGGLDSRLTNLALARTGVTNAHAVTLNLEDGEELTLAETITSRLGFAHEKLELPEGGDRDLRDAWLLTGGQVPIHAAASNLPAYRSQLSNRPHVRIVGAWPADLLVGDFVPSFDEFAQAESLSAALKFWVADITRRAPALLLFGRSKFVRNHLRSIRKTVNRQIREYAAPTAAQRISHWAFDHCAPGFTLISPARLTANVLEVAPVMSPDVIRNFYRLRGIDLPNRNFYQRMIWQTAPELRDVKYHNTGKLLRPDYQPLPSMSWKLRALLRLPLPHYAFLKSVLDRASSRRALAPTVSVSTQHWDKMFEPHIRDGLKFTNRLVANPGAIQNPHARVQLTATVLGCAWTREYLQGFAAESSASSAGAAMAAAHEY